jgi:hypothetical protein
MESNRSARMVLLVGGINADDTHHTKSGQLAGGDTNSQKAEQRNSG